MAKTDKLWPTFAEGIQATNPRCMVLIYMRSVAQTTGNKSTIKPIHTAEYCKKSDNSSCTTSFAENRDQTHWSTVHKSTG